MARPRTFDQDQVLDIAIDVFRQKGYEGASTDDLVTAMGIGRQSLYGAFGDKRSLYLAALQRYNERSVGEIIEAGRRAPTPGQAIEAALLHFADHHAKPGTAACLGVHSICEFGTSDGEVERINRTSGRQLERFFERSIADAQVANEMAATLDPKAAAGFLASTLVGMKVAARGGATPKALRSIAGFALRGLRR